jgi:hypothetical protein
LQRTHSWYPRRIQCFWRCFSLSHGKVPPIRYPLDIEWYSQSEMVLSNFN